MSEIKYWGYFLKSGEPVATGDSWHEYKCPDQRYERVGYECNWTGEWVDEGYKAVPCPFECTGVKTDVCTQCGLTFKYP